MEKDIETEKRFEKIEDMLRHIHGHVENIDNKTFVIREGLQLVSQTIGDAVEYTQKGKFLHEKAGKFDADIYRCIEILTEGAKDGYSPIDEKDKEIYEEEEKEREKIMGEKLENSCKSA